MTVVPVEGAWELARIASRIFQVQQSVYAPGPEHLPELKASICSLFDDLDTGLRSMHLNGSTEAQPV